MLVSDPSCANTASARATSGRQFAAQAESRRQPGPGWMAHCSALHLLPRPPATASPLMALA
eukprot:2670857-Pyramimonas_sp.AAC.1